MSETGIARVDSAMGVLADRAQTLENRAAAFAVLHQVQLRVNRALKASRDDIVKGMQSGGLRDLGPLSIKSTAVDPRYECNEEGAWEDDLVQDALRELLGDRELRPYVKAIPKHLEVNVERLIEDLRLGVQAAIVLFAELTDRHFRVERERRYSLTVREAVAPKREKVPA